MGGFRPNTFGGGGEEDWYTYGTVIPTEVLEGMKFYELLI